MRTYEQRFDDEVTPKVFWLEFESMFDYLSTTQEFSSLEWEVSGYEARATNGNETLRAKRIDALTIEVLADDPFTRALLDAGYQQVFITAPPNDPYEEPHDEFDGLFD